MFRRIFISIIGLLLFTFLVIFNSCSLVDSGGGSNDANSGTAKEEVKWEKFVQLERPNLAA